jgi:hypothetical protein
MAAMVVRVEHRLTAAQVVHQHLDKVTQAHHQAQPLDLQAAVVEQVRLVPK